MTCTAAERNKLQLALRDGFILTDEPKYRNQLWTTLGKLPEMMCSKHGYGDDALGFAFQVHCLALKRWDASKCASYGKYFCYRLRASIEKTLRRQDSVVYIPQKEWDAKVRATLDDIQAEDIMEDIEDIE